MVSVTVSPKFTEEEVKDIDCFVNSGNGRNRSDFVRKATLFFMVQEKQR